MTTIGIIGSGHVGTSLARAAITHGYDVVLSNSQGPDSLANLVAELGPKARAATPEKAAAAGDFAIVAIPITDRHPGRVMRGRDSSGIVAADPEDPDDLWPSVSRLAIVVLTKRLTPIAWPRDAMSTGENRKTTWRSGTSRRWARRA